MSLVVRRQVIRQHWCAHFLSEAMAYSTKTKWLTGKYWKFSLQFFRISSQMGWRKHCKVSEVSCILVVECIWRVPKVNMRFQNGWKMKQTLHCIGLTVSVWRLALFSGRSVCGGIGSIFNVAAVFETHVCADNTLCWNSFVIPKRHGTTLTNLHIKKNIKKIAEFCLVVFL